VESYSLSQVNQYIKQVIAVNFPERIWVQAEISQVKESRGQYYLELVEKHSDSDEVIARADAVIWYRSYLAIQNKLGSLTSQILQDGTQVQLRVSIQFHEKYGLKFNIEEIDPSYTFGQLEMNRQKTIERLQKEELIGKNRKIAIERRILQRIAVISSENAAGLQDFERQLHDNPYGYAFHTSLFSASVQGRNLETEILARLKEIRRNYHLFDAVVIIRGGGSKLDLSGFDSYEIARSVAEFPIPVYSGIGHDIDQNVIELVVFEALKTPTAVANYLLEHNLVFENEILNIYERIRSRCRHRLTELKSETDHLERRLHVLSQSYMKNQIQMLDNTSRFLHQAFRGALFAHGMQLEQTEQKISLSDPVHILEKGYSVAYFKEQPLRSVRNISEGDEFELLLKDGRLRNIVNKIITGKN